MITEESKPQQCDNKQDLGLGQDDATNSVSPVMHFQEALSTAP